MDRSTRTLLIVGFAVSLIVAVGVSQLASGDPDGLEYVAEQEGFIDNAEEHDLAESPLADYGEGLTGNEAVDTALAGLAGVLVTLGIGWAVFRFMRRRDDMTVG